VRQGVALLIVLAMIVLVVPIAVGLARQSVLSQVEHNLNSHATTARSLVRQIELGPILHWLEEESSKVVLDIECQWPLVEVWSDQWQFEEVDYELRVTAWDQCGMVPLTSDARASSLWRSLATQVTGRISQLPESGQNSPLGLDQMGLPTVESDRVTPSVFPTRSMDDPMAVGAWVATHSDGGFGSINVNTAPTPLIKAAMQLAGRGDFEQILIARQSGKQSPLPSVTADSGASIRSGTDHAPRFVGTSHAWAFRVDIQVGTVKQSWWSVFKQQRSRWECVQRLVIDH
jgi:hypothetical protein